MSGHVPVVEEKGRWWVVRMPTSQGVQEYVCESEEQARRLEALLATPIREPAQRARSEVKSEWVRGRKHPSHGSTSRG